jgi:translation initiation factor IF-2
MLAPEYTEKVIGKATVLAVFSLSKGGKVAGCKVSEVEVRRNAKLRLLRGKDTVYEGDVASLKHEKEDVREMRAGFECGIGLKNFSDIQVGDLIECYVLEKAEAE